MRVLYVLHDAPAYSGSSKSFMNFLLKLKEKRNMEFLVVCPSKNEMFDLLIKREIDVRKLVYGFNAFPSVKTYRGLLLYVPLLLRRLLLNRKASNELCKIVNDFHPDIIHTNVSVINIGYNASRKNKIPHVWHIREYQNLGLGIRVFPSVGKFIQNLQSSINHSICITEGIQSYYNLERQSEVIYDGVASSCAIQFRETKQPYFLFVGYLVENKGIRDVIMAFGEFCRQVNTGIQLWIAGETTNRVYYDELVTLTQKMGIVSRVIFLGVRKDVFNLMADATALVVPSYWEGFGFITAEAMFNGCLVIGRNTSGTKEQFNNGFNRYGKEIALRFNTTDELVGCMRDVVTHGVQYYFPLMKLAQETVVALYSIETYVEKVYSYYCTILKKQ